MLEEENEDRQKLGFIGGEAKGAGHANAENGEVQTVNIWRGGRMPGHEHSPGENGLHTHTHTNGQASQQETTRKEPLTKELISKFLEKLPSEDVWRVKGFLRLAANSNSDSESSYHILNWAFGRYELHAASERMSERLGKEGIEVRLTVMGARGESKRRARILAQNLGAEIS